MRFRPKLLQWAGVVPLVSLVAGLAGCGGGSSNSSSFSTPPAQTPATIMKDNNGQTSIPSYSITVAPSGVATYGTQIAGQQAQTGSGTVPGPLVAKFFQDLAAAQPLSKLPAPNVPVSSQSSFLFVQYGDQKARLSDSTDTRAQGLAADATAIAQALGLPANAIGG